MREQQELSRNIAAETPLVSEPDDAHRWLCLTVDQSVFCPDRAEIVKVVLCRSIYFRLFAGESNYSEFRTAERAVIFRPR